MSRNVFKKARKGAVPSKHMGVEIIFKIAAIGILTGMINALLKKADKEEIATLTTLAGLILVLIIVVDMIVQLFDTIKILFTL